VAGIFVSYRRKDSAGHAGRVYDRLRERYGAKLVFRDVDYLKPGEDFVDALARAVDACDVFICVIGPDWAEVRNERGERRLDDPDDFIRLEVETALRRQTLLLPVLVEGARMPEAAELPEALRPLSRRQAIELSEHRWDFDVQQLLRRIDEVLGARRRFPLRRMGAAAAAVLALAIAGFIALPRLLDGDGPPTADADTANATGTLAAAESTAAPLSIDSAAATPPGGPPALQSGGAGTPRTTPADTPDVEPQPPPEAEPPAARPGVVPEVRGLSPRDAMGALRAASLTPVPLWTRQAGSTAIVRTQQWRAGTVLKPGAEVRYTYVLPLGEGEAAAGRAVLIPKRGFDLDVGNEGAGPDLIFDITEGAGPFLYAAKGAQAGMLSLPATVRPGPRSCDAAKWGLSRLLLDRTSAETVLCIRTSRGLHSLIRVDTVIASPPEVLIRYTTWR
jgi:hypothetical protein